MTTELAQEFAITVRGYDRAQVDSYVDTLREWLSNATVRMEAAEADSGNLREQVVLLRTRTAQLEHQVGANPPRTLEALGDRVSRILLLAEEGAVAARADAEAEAVAILGRARTDASAMVSTAQVREAEAEALMTTAGERAASLIAQAEATAAENAHRILAEAEARAQARETESLERARTIIADIEAERDFRLGQLAEEKVLIGGELRRLAAERDEMRDGLTRLKESLHRTISELAGTPVPA